MNKLIYLLPVSLGLALAACDEPGFVSVESRSGYYADDADFYYVGRTPYSRNYGPLIYRNDGYYYRSGQSYVIYDRPTRRWRDSDARVREYRREERRDDRDDRFDDRRDDRREFRDDVRDDRREFREDVRDDRREVRQDVRVRRDDVRGDLRDVSPRRRSIFGGPL